MHNLQLTPDILEKLNQLLHLNCQFDIIFVELIQIYFFPRIRVQISGIKIRGYSKSPNDWDKEIIENALALSRLEILDRLTAAIVGKLKMRAFDQTNTWLYLPLHCIDIMIATALIKINTTSISFCSRRNGQPDDIMVRVTLEELLVTPSTQLSDLIFGPMFQMDVTITGLSLASVYYEDDKVDKLEIPPLLYPTNVQGNILLPKITSQLIRNEALLSKFCRLDLKVDHITVDLCAVNAVEVLNFTLGIVLYRLWYTNTINSFEKHLERVQIASLNSSETIASYLALYSSFVSCQSISRKRQFLNSCREIEKTMSSSSIRLARALALGWRENQNFYQYLRKTRLNDVSLSPGEGTEAFSKIINSTFEIEYLNSKELRFIEVLVSANQVDFRLSTPRTRWDLRNPEKSAPPVTLSLMDIHLSVVDPIVPACYLFDRVRDVNMEVGRIRLAAGESFAPNSANSCLTKIIWDQCWIRQGEDLEHCSLDYSSESHPMVKLKIHEDPDIGVTTVHGNLVNSTLMLDILNTIEILEYGLTVVEDLASILSYWTSYVELPPSPPPHLPASILGGNNLRVSVEAKNFGITLLEHQLPVESIKDSTMHSNIFRINFDMTVLIVSHRHSESILGTMKDIHFGTYRQDTTLRSIDSPYRGIRSCHIILYPCMSLGSSLDQSSAIEFTYQLHFGSSASTSFRLLEPVEQSFVSDRKFYRRRKSVARHINTSRTDTPQSLLSRYISLKSDPLVVNISEQEAKIIFRWAKQSIRTIPQAIASLNINVTKIQGTALEMSLKLEKFEYMTFMNKLFKKLGVSAIADHIIPPEMMNSIFELFLRPLHLTTSEFEEYQRQLFLYFDKNLDQRISVKEFEERGLELYSKIAWRLRDFVPLTLREYSGVSVANYFTRALQDNESLNEVWRRIEFETPLRRSWTTLRDGITPLQVQSLLVRVCEDANIAKLLWENVIRTNFNDPQLKIYPWYSNEDTAISSRHSLGEHAHEIIGKRKFGSTDPHYDSNDYYISGVSQPSRENTALISDISRTEFDISLSTIQLNFIDALLGPKMPRYQLNIVTPTFQGCFSHDGLAPKMSFSSSPNLVANLKGSVSVESSFFNSHVGAHEPLIEPYTLLISILKNSTGSIKIDFQDQGPLVFNISTTLMQTISAFVISLEEVTHIEFDDEEEDQLTSEVVNESISPFDVGALILSPCSHHQPCSIPLPSTCSSSPLIVIQNDCGAPLSVSLCLYPQRQPNSKSGSGSPRIVLSETEILPQTHAQVLTPWELISSKYGESAFPLLVFSVMLVNENNHQDYYRIHFLHSLSTEKIFIPLLVSHTTSTSHVKSRSCHDSFIPAIIFDYKPNIERGELLLKHSAVLYARSNIQFKNTAGQSISLKFFSKSHIVDPVELSIKDLDVQTLSIQLACVADLCIAFKHGSSKDWSSDYLLRDILYDRQHVHHETSTTLVLIVGHEILKNKMEQVDDFIVEIVSGIRIVNSLPYHIEVKCNEMSGAKSHSLSPKLIRLQPGRCALIPMIRAGSTFSLRLLGKQRINTDEDDNIIQRKNSRPIEWIEWSNAVELRDVLNGNGSNVTEETVEVPCKFFPKLKVKLRKIRDPSKDESFVKRYTSTPTIEIYTDIWIQNNSGLRLTYRLKSRSTGEVALVNDNYCGYSSLSSTSTSGPILGLVMLTSLQLKIEMSQRTDDHLVCLQDFSNVSVEMPNLSQQSKNQWSAKLRISDTSFTSFELLLGNIYFGLSLQPGIGVFHRTKILVITPRYVIQNLTTSLINVFPVRIWKRYRISSTGAESESVREYMDNIDSMYSRKSSVDAGDAVRESGIGEEWSSYGAVPEIVANEGYNDILEPDDEVIFRDSTDAFIGELPVDSIPPDYSEDSFSVKVHSSDALYFTLSPSCVSSFYSFRPTSPKLSSMVHSLCPALSLRIDSFDPRSREIKDPLPNSLRVKIMSALNLSSFEHLGFVSNPKCLIYWMGELLHQSKGSREMREESRSDEWNETFSIPVDVEDLLYADLRIEIVDLDLGVYSDFLGQMTITGDEILECTYHPKVISRKLKPKYSRDQRKIQGELKVEICLEHKSLNTWSSPFFINNRTVEYLTVRNNEGRKKLLEIRIHDIDSVLVVVIKEHTSSNLPAFKIVNRTPDLQLRFRQHHTNRFVVPRNVVPSASYCYYAWDNLCLPKLIEIVAVDDSGHECPSILYSLENVGLQTGKLYVKELDNNREYLKAQIFVEGHTRVLVISNDESEIPESKLIRSYLGKNYFLSLIMATDIEMVFSGFSVSLIDEHPEELITVDIDKIRLHSAARSMSWEFTVNHIQLDNMTVGTTRYPVILSPPDSGLNSHLHEDYNDINQFIPSFKVVFEPDLDNFGLTKDAFVINHLDINLQDLMLCIDFNFLVKMITSIVTPSVLEAYKVGLRFWATIQKDPITQTHDILTHRIHSPHNRLLPEYMVMLKKLVIHSTVVKIMLAIAMDNADLDPHNMGTGGKIEYSTVQTLISLSRGITNINPLFSFTGLVIDDAFDTIDNLGWRIGLMYATQVIVQTLKIVGSAEILGDPVGAIATLGSSVRVFVKKTKSELKGHSQTLGGGLKNLVQGVSGISFGSAAKMTKSIGEQLASISGSDFKTYMHEEDASHVGSGVVQGGTVFAKSVVNGVINIGKKPLEGIQAGSVSQTAVGVVSGLSGLALAPVIGVLGFTAKVSQGIDSSTHIFDEKPHGRKRPARALFHDPKLKPLSRSKLFHRFSLHFKGVQLMKNEYDIYSDAYLSISYGSQHQSSTIFKLCSTLPSLEFNESVFTFHFQAEMDKPSFRTQLLKIKLHLAGSSRFGGGKTIAKCYIHPVDIMSYFIPENVHATATSSVTRRRGFPVPEEGRDSPLLSTYSGPDTMPVSLHTTPPNSDSNISYPHDGDETVSSMTLDSSHNTRIDKKSSFLDFAYNREILANHYRCHLDEITVSSSLQHPDRYEFTLRLISKDVTDDESHYSRPNPVPTLGSDDIYETLIRDIFCHVTFTGSYPPL